MTSRATCRGTRTHNVGEEVDDELRDEPCDEPRDEPRGVLRYPDVRRSRSSRRRAARRAEAPGHTA
jgi:hypothetical protein